MSQPQELGLRAQVLDVVPPGPIHRNRRSAVAKFSHRIPNFRDPGCTFSLVPDPRAGALVDAVAKKKEDTVSRLRQQQQQQRAGPDVKVPLLLEQRDAAAGGSGPPAAVFKGVPEAGGGANVDGPPLHYILFRSGNRVTAFPAEQWFAFKPHVDRRGLLDSVAAANAAKPASGGGVGGVKELKAPLDPFALRLVPKSQRLEKQRQEEEARERQEQVAAGRLLPLAGAVADELGRGGRLKRFVDEDELEEELFGNDEEDEAPRFGGKGGKGAKKGGRGRGLKTADGEELGEDEMPEDLYAGPAVDEDLRPEKPEEAEDWEHEFAPDDDDQDQGHDEVYEDDPGMRKKLGIEADDEDEGEEADEQARKLKKLGDPDDSDEEEEEQKKKEEEEEARRQQAAAAAAAQGAAAGGDEDDQGEEDEDELEELDEMEEDSPKPPPRPASVPPAAARPPPAPGAAAAAAAGTKRRVAEESRPTTEGAKRARTATPPPPVAAGAGAPGAAARPVTPAAAAGAAPAVGAGAGAAAQQQQRPAGGAAAAAAGAAGGGAPAAGAGGAGAGPPITAEEVIDLLRRQPAGIMPFQSFTRHFSKRITTPELRAGLKSLTVSLCKSSKNEAGQLMLQLRKD
ncbi:hypothetical protein PLESTB_001087400 [Pleodorina starrii]|uniref:Transcription initiation factor IIF subunit alpha n=1 Tax=Pleodorina starrii TaxID=330485 RepID=A0A9W6F4M0_9CHLO|nr:hypothetical protein PLESTM_000698900 [Pleodorina starrii]GLC56277.1 hypothetical protein PLESTB_001087400 [Pleodorina starrii]GLC69621.1 hypothetical protein PLESTF_000855800 [Pleodorina starrii]